jgi:DNA-binding NarL/FixJ family response regulator
MKQPKPLTARQREVLRLVVEGRTMKEIAASLGLSVKTVEAHRAQMMERLGIHDVPGLVRYAMRIGLLRPERPHND